MLRLGGGEWQDIALKVDPGKRPIEVAVEEVAKQVGKFVPRRGPEAQVNIHGVF